MKIYEQDIKKLFRQSGLRKDDVLRSVIMPDKHVPDHCLKTHEATLQFLEYYQPHVFGSIGDFYECGPVSHWEGQADFYALANDLEEGRKVAEELFRASGPNLIYKFLTKGNHEKWYDRILKKNRGMVQLFEKSGADVSLERVSGLDELFDDIFEYNEVLEIGDTGFTHGLYTNVFHSKKHVDMYGKTLIYGHCESQQLYTKSDARGVVQGISIGTQRDESKCHFIGGRPTNWVTGLCLIEWLYDGTSTIYMPKITNGKFSFNGELFGGKK